MTPAEVLGTLGACIGVIELVRSEYPSGQSWRHGSVFKPKFSDLLPFFIRQLPKISDTYSELLKYLLLIIIH